MTANTGDSRGPGPIRVWAPRATEVAVDFVDGPLVVATAEAGPDGAPTGWHGADVPAALVERGHPIDYALRLDGGPPRPDPRSRWQPDGVHGPSRLIDLDAHAWADDEFRPTSLQDATIYELHVGTFSAAGTFLGVIEHLDDLVDLGVTHVELLPVNAFAGEHGWGYDGVDLYAPHRAYGHPHDLQDLVDACHQRGLAVLLDVVYNHLGPEGNYLGELGPYFTDRHHTPWGDALNVDGPDSDEVRRFVVDNALHWLRHYHVDGLRLDAVHAIIDTSAVHLLEQLRCEVDALSRDTGRPYVLVAEYEGNDPRLVRDLDLGGYGLDAVWADDVHHALHTALTGERSSYYADYDGLADLVRCLHDGVAYAGRWSPFRRRTVGRDHTGISGAQLVACLQNHDQVGNRARGERAAELMGPARQAIGAALLLTGPWVPLLFQGEEWAATSPFPFFADHDGELAEAVRAGRRAEFAEFGWAPEDVTDPEDPGTFAAATLRWDERNEPAHATMLAWYRTLIGLRRTDPALRDPSLPVTAELDGPRLVVHRPGIAGELLVVAAVGDEADLDLPPWAILRAEHGGAVLDDAGSLRLPADSVAIVEVPTASATG